MRRQTFALFDVELGVERNRQRLSRVGCASGFWCARGGRGIGQRVMKGVIECVKSNMCALCVSRLTATVHTHTRIWNSNVRNRFKASRRFGYLNFVAFVWSQFQNRNTPLKLGKSIYILDKLTMMSVCIVCVSVYLYFLSCTGWSFYIDVYPEIRNDATQRDATRVSKKGGTFELAEG